MTVEERVQSLEESVLLKLEDEILSGKLKRGDTLTEASLTARLGASRTPVRAALHRLAEDGLVEISPNKGAVVLGITNEDLINIYKIRIRLEGLASREAAAKISDEDKKNLTDSVELSEFYIKKQDAEKIKELDSKFHDIIYKASGNRLLGKILSDLHKKIKRYRKISLSVNDRLKKSVGEHREILYAILSGNTEEADRLTVLHIEAALNNLIAVLKSNRKET